MTRAVSAYLNASSGFPDSLFSNPKSQFGEILEGIRLENVYILYGIMNHEKSGNLVHPQEAVNFRQTEKPDKFRFVRF
jgi:hypothetical protein